MADSDGPPINDDRSLMHRVFVEEPEGIAETVGDVPVCPTCLRAFQAGKYGPVVCDDCFDENNIGAGGKRYITPNGEKKHYSPLCPHVRSSKYWMTSDETCVYSKRGPCATCGPGGRARRVATDGGRQGND